MPNITLPDGSVRSYEQPVTVLDVAASIGEGLARAARAGKVWWLGHASDAGGDGSRRLDQAWRVGEDKEGSGMAGESLPLDRAGLSVALGRDNTVHLALTDRAAAGRVSTLLARLNHYLGHDGATADGPGNAGLESGGPAAQRASEP